MPVFEVKSGYIGGYEAQTQIFKWIERKLIDGSEIVIPGGTKILHAGEGPLDLVKTTMRFTFEPVANAKVPKVLDLASAERHKITAFGVSHLGIGSSQQVAAKVIPHPLALKSSELDYLVALIIPLLRRRS